MKARTLILLEHYFRGFNHSGDGIADLQLHFFGAASSYYAVDDVVADSDQDMGHHVPELELLDLANQMITDGEFHG
jgi:hypothetical protein